MQQDFIEHFFGIIRQHGGWNDNPTCLQIKYIMRKLIVNWCGGLTPSLYTNSTSTSIIFELEVDEDLPEDQTNVVFVMADHLDVRVEETTAELSLGNFKKRTLAYIAGYVVFKVSKQITCITCREALANSPADSLDSMFASLIRLKSNGALIEPSSSVFIIIIKQKRYSRDNYFLKHCL